MDIRTQIIYLEGSLEYKRRKVQELLDSKTYTTELVMYTSELLAQKCQLNQLRRIEDAYFSTDSLS